MAATGRARVDMPSKTVSQPPLFYSAAEAAALLGVSTAVVRDAVALGQLPGCRLGRRQQIRIHRAALFAAFGVTEGGELR